LKKFPARVSESDTHNNTNNPLLQFKNAVTVSEIHPKDYHISNNRMEIRMIKPPSKHPASQKVAG
jgi:hypothetical protein